ncbi:HNH endonuclease [Curtobacterium sp. MCSS17_011]|nr:HNH endonuclease [Curtobacterium sp. MCSS17_011]
MRETVLERDRYQCFRCGRSILTGAYSIHHRRPRGMGGTSAVSANLAANAVTLCGTGTAGCHGWTEAHRRDAFRLGLLMPQGTDPAAVPILHHRAGWVNLDELGGQAQADRFAVVDWEARWA